MQTDMHTAEPLVPESNSLEFEIAIEKLKSHKLPGNDQTPGELLKSEGKMIHYEIHTLVNSVSNKEKMSNEWKE